MTLTCRSSDPWDRPWRCYWYGTGWGTDVLRLSITAGHIAARIMRFAHQRNFVDEDSYIALYVSVALLTVGAASSLGNDDLLAALAAGLLIVHDDIVLPLILMYRLCDLLERRLFQATT
jgi:hypothetical protein